MTKTRLQRLIIHAPSIHCGGGLVLLEALMQALALQRYPVFALLDTRLPEQFAIPEKVQVTKFPPSLQGRFLAEKKLEEIVNADDIILCLGLPPLSRLPGKVILFLQNRLLLDSKTIFLVHYGLRVGLRIFLERIWLRIKKNNVDQYVVQTPSMKNALHNSLNIMQKITVQPFLTTDQEFSRQVEKQLKKDAAYDFIYVASGDYHKNHRKLVEAWCLLAEQGIYPHLCLTIDALHYAKLCHWIEEKIQKCNLKITNKGALPHNEVLLLYQQSQALIFPSIFESFGLPLIEARKMGLPILASELDFVRDTIDPEETFDPSSGLSISRAVKRFLNVPHEDLILVKAEDFLKTIVIN